MKLFVTGASGFIGSAFVKAAVQSGHETTVFARNADAWRLRPIEGRYQFVPGELADTSVLSRALSATRPDVVVHLAWAGVAGLDRNQAVQIRNIGWSTDLMLAAADAGVSHFISTGSQAEYGPKSGVVAPDATELPTTLYGESKLATYRLLNRIAELKSMRLSWLRVFSTYGATDHPYWMIPNLIGTLLRGEKPSLTEGLQRWDFLHVSDAASALLAAAQSATASGIYNLGSGSAPVLRDTITTIRDAIDPDLPLGFGETPYRADQVMHLQADTTRLNQELGWHPTMALNEGLVETVTWYRQNPWIFEQ